MRELKYPFFREAQIQRFIKGLEDFSKNIRRHLLLVGPEGRGKSLVIDWVLNNISYHNLPKVCWDLEFMDRTSFFESIKLFCQRMQFAASPEFVSFLTYFDNLLKEKNTKGLIIVKNFEYLQRIFTPQELITFSRKIIFLSNIMFIFISSNPFRARTVMSKDYDNLFRGFEEIYFDNFSTQESRRFLEIKLKDKSLSEELLEFIINLTQGVPCYLDFFAERLNQMESQIIDFRNFSSLLYEELFQKGFLYQRVKNFLFQCSHGSPLSLLRKIFVFDYNENISGYLSSKILQELREKGIVYKRGYIYSLYDPIFKFWLRHFSQFSMDYSEFFKILNNVFYHFLEARKCNLVERTTQLFKQLGGHYIEIEEKRLYIPQVEKIEFVSQEPKRIFLKTSTGQTLIIGFKEGNVYQRDVEHFLYSLKYPKNRRTFKILLVGEGNLDLDARILAKESKIYLMGLSHLNGLFSLFDIPLWIKNLA